MRHKIRKPSLGFFLILRWQTSGRPTRWKEVTVAHGHTLPTLTVKGGERLGRGIGCYKVRKGKGQEWVEKGKGQPALSLTGRNAANTYYYMHKYRKHYLISYENNKSA